MVAIGFWWLVASVLVGLALAGDLGLTQEAGRFIVMNAVPAGLLGFALHAIALRVRRSHRRKQRAAN